MAPKPRPRGGDTSHRPGRDRPLSSLDRELLEEEIPSSPEHHHDPSYNPRTDLIRQHITEPFSLPDRSQSLTSQTLLAPDTHLLPQANPPPERPETSSVTNPENNQRTDIIQPKPKRLPRQQHLQERKEQSLQRIQQAINPLTKLPYSKQRAIELYNAQKKTRTDSSSETTKDYLEYLKALSNTNTDPNKSFLPPPTQEQLLQQKQEKSLQRIQRAIDPQTRLPYTPKRALDLYNAQKYKNKPLSLSSQTQQDIQAYNRAIRETKVSNDTGVVKQAPSSSQNVSPKYTLKKSMSSSQTLSFPLSSHPQTWTLTTAKKEETPPSSSSDFNTDTEDEKDDQPPHKRPRNNERAPSPEFTFMTEEELYGTSFSNTTE